MAKTKKTKVSISMVLLLLAVVLVSIVYVGRIIPKDLGDLLPDLGSSIKACTIENVDKGKIELDESDSIKFKNILAERKYYYGGKADKILEGNLYHINFSSIGDKGDNIVSDIIFSDEGLIYLADKEYKVKSGSEDIIEFLNIQY